MSQIENFKDEWTPAGSCLGVNKDDAPFDEAEFGFSYSSVIGMLLCQIHTRCDIQVAVHQYARFTHSPKRSHGIARYLCATKKQWLEQGLDFDVCQGPV